MKFSLVAFLLAPLAVSCSVTATTGTPNTNEVTPIPMADPTQVTPMPSAPLTPATPSGSKSVSTPNGEPLNLRDAAGNVLAVLPDGTSVEITGRLSADGYLPVTANGASGFAFAQYIK